MYCRYCGKAIADDSLFCSNCGKCLGEKESENFPQIPIWDKIEKDAVEFSPIEEEDKKASTTHKAPISDGVKRDFIRGFYGYLVLIGICVLIYFIISSAN